MRELAPGEIFAGHRIEGVAGRGGFGVVYRATHLALDHIVALKVISGERAADETFRDRFKSESRIAVSIRHPNVVAVHHAGEEDGRLFVTMDFIEGTDLRGLLNREGRLDPQRAVPIVSQVASALDAAHERGLVHRDIKPGNVLIEGGEAGNRVFLTDFGLSKRIDATSGVTASGAFVGTLDYVAPEQIKGERVDARTDVYALGCVLYELLTGEVPFAGEREKVAKMYAHLQEAPPPLGDVAPEVPRELGDAIWRALEKDPERRYPSAGDLARAAKAATEGRAPSEPERNVGIGAAAPTQVFDAVGPPETAEAAQPAAGAEERTAEATRPHAPPEPSTVAPPPAEAPTEEPATRKPARPEPPTPPAKRSGRPSPRLIAGVVGALALALAAFVVLGGSEKSPEGGGAGGGGGGGSPPPLGTVERGVPVAELPVGIAVGKDAAWAASRNGGELSRIPADADVPDRTVAATGPEGVTVGEGAVWAVAQEGGQLYKITANSPTPETLAIDGGPAGVAVEPNAVWVTLTEVDTVARVAPDLSGELGRTTVGAAPYGVATGEGSAWVTNREGDSVTQLDLVDGTEIREIAVGDNPKGLTVAAGKVWVTNTDDATVSSIEPGSDQAGDPIEVAPEPRDIVFGFNRLWVSHGDGTVSVLDPKSGEALGTIKDVGDSLEDIAAGLGSVWVADGGGDQVLRITP
ncbi:MAG: protein kinase [bacterium]